MTNKTASKKTTAKSAAKMTKAAPKTKPPAKAKQVKPLPLPSEPETTETVETEAVKIEQVQDTAPTKAKKPERQASERYEVACLEVSTANKAFLSALQERCRLMGTSLKGESCGIQNASPELAVLSERIKAARQTLDGLLQQRRDLMNVSPEVEAINLKIAGLRKFRSRARQEKKKIAAAEIGL